jgi:hypothetical protein
VRYHTQHWGLATAGVCPDRQVLSTTITLGRANGRRGSAGWRPARCTGRRHAAGAEGSVTVWRCVFGSGCWRGNDAGDTHSHGIACRKCFAQAFVERFALVPQAWFGGRVCLAGRRARCFAGGGHHWLLACGSGGEDDKCDRLVQKMFQAMRWRVCVNPPEHHRARMRLAEPLAEADMARAKRAARHPLRQRAGVLVELGARPGRHASGPAPGLAQRLDVAEPARRQPSGKTHCNAPGPARRQVERHRMALGAFPRAATRAWQQRRWNLLAGRAEHWRQQAGAASGTRDARMLQNVLAANLATRPGRSSSSFRTRPMTAVWNSARRCNYSWPSATRRRRGLLAASCWLFMQTLDPPHALLATYTVISTGHPPEWPVSCRK